MASDEADVELAIKHAAEKAARAIDVSALPREVQTVAIVYSVQGAVDNGGLQYLFEADFPNTPPYSMFVAAYRMIGAEAAANALEQAVALFPFESPHLHVKKRNKFMDTFKDEDGDTVNSPFDAMGRELIGNEDVWEKLRLYVRTHQRVLHDKCVREQQG